MYKAGADNTAAKCPECLDELGARTQERYLLLADAAIKITGLPTPVGDAEVATALAEVLAWKLNNPSSGFPERARNALQEFAESVGGDVSDEVERAMQI